MIKNAHENMFDFLVKGDLGCVCLSIKYFLSLKYFQMKIFLRKEDIFKCLAAI